MKIKPLVIVLLAGAVVTGCVTAKEKLTESGGVKMTKSEVVAINADLTSIWVSGNGASYQATNGHYLYKMSDGKSGEGEWSVTDAGTVCIQVKDWWEGEKRCNWEYYKKGNVEYIYDIRTDSLEVSGSDRRTKGNTLQSVSF